MHSYSAFGLQFSSQVELPEFLISHHDNSDVTITFGEVPNTLGDQAAKSILYEATPNQFLLKIEHVANYLVQSGRKITIQPIADPTNSDIRIFLLGTCMGALLHQRGSLALHASAISTEQGAILFTGPSGIGKSTLLTAFVKRGYKMLTDDISAIFLNTEQSISIMPGFPRTKLWDDAAKVLEVNTSQLARTRQQLEKFEYHIPQHFELNPKPIARIYHLTASNQNSLSINNIPKMRIVQTLVLNTYRQHFLDGLAMRESHFHLLSKVAQMIPVRRISRPRTPYRLDDLVDTLESDLRSNS